MLPDSYIYNYMSHFKGLRYDFKRMYSFTGLMGIVIATANISTPYLDNNCLSLDNTVG